jgi:hypothetical protein
VEPKFTTGRSRGFNGKPREFSDRRAGGDRRARKLRIFSGYQRRKSKGRRESDRANYVDVYDAGSWGIAIAVLCLSIADALMTNLHITAGRSREANPLMQAVIARGGMHAFVWLKAAMTALPLAVIMVHKEWKLARFAARVCLWSYILIALYHIYLLCI